jgi:hypothetical protein
MAVKKKGKRWKTGRLHWPGSRREHEKDLAAKLTPLEETEEFKESPQTDSKRNGDDTIRVDSASVRVPDNLVEDERSASSTFKLEPVVLALLLIALAFIAFIAWQITLMPEK